MGAELSEGLFRVTACENGHISLEVLDGEGLTVFLSVMERDEASSLALQLLQAAEVW